jgi:hypothetical protein
MWDSLGVLALRGRSGLARMGSRLGTHARTEPMLPFAGFTLGGPIVPRVKTTARGAVAAFSSWWHEVAARLAGLRAGEESELRPFRVSIDDARPAMPGAVLRLAAWVLAGAVALAVVVYVVGTIAARGVASLVE